MSKIPWVAHGLNILALFLVLLVFTAFLTFNIVTACTIAVSSTKIGTPSIAILKSMQKSDFKSDYLNQTESGLTVSLW